MTNLKFRELPLRAEQAWTRLAVVRALLSTPEFSSAAARIPKFSFFFPRSEPSRYLDIRFLGAEVAGCSDWFRRPWPLVDGGCPVSKETITDERAEDVCSDSRHPAAGIYKRALSRRPVAGMYEK